MANTKVTGDLIASGTITAANLVSGTLDGILGTYLSTNSYATESYVTTAVSNLIDAAPASLDTLNELAAALNDDANFATTVTDSIATKLPLAGGTLTGSLDINASDALRFRFLNSGTFKAGVEVATTAGDMIASSVIDDLAIRSQTNMLFSTGGNTERMRITSTGNVGIGTASPEAKLDVNGAVFINSNYTGSNAAANDLTIGKITTGDHGITIATGSTYTGSIYFGDSGNNDAGIIGYQHSNNSMKFTTNRSEKMRIDSAGNVGIGTASPASFTWSRFLHIEGIYAGLVYNSTAGGSPFKFSTGVDDNVYIFRDETNSATRMAIDSIGNVGIGTSSPGSKLEISSTSDALLELNGGTTTNPYMLFAQNGTRRAFIQYVNGGLLSLASEYGDIRFMTGAGGTETEKMRIDSSGRVGIGTSSPTYKMEIDGGSAETRLRISTSGIDADEAGIILANSTKVAFNDGIQIAHGGGVTTFKDLAGEVQMAIDVSNSRVGIGTSSPSSKLTVEDGDFARLDLNLANSTGTTIADIRGLVEGTEKWRIGRLSSASDDFAINILGSEAMRINSSGNVGIGVSPSASFHLGGTDSTKSYIDRGSSTRLQIFQSNDGQSHIGSSGSNAALILRTGTTFGTDTERMRIDSSGNVGIGTTSPSATLDINSQRGTATNLSSSKTAAGFDLNSNTAGGTNSLTIGETDQTSYFLQHANSAGTTAYNLALNPYGGNVGIGTTAPGEKLSVSGNIESLDTFILNYGNNGIKWQQLFDGGNNWNLRYYNGTAWSSSAITVKTNNNVGIGTTAPDAKLHIALNGG
jgi:hypothetical protein